MPEGGLPQGRQADAAVRHCQGRGPLQDAPTEVVCVVGSSAESLVVFRGDFIRELLRRGIRVHVAAPELPASSELRATLRGWGVVVHQIRLERTGLNPVADAAVLRELVELMLMIRPTHVLAYTAKPVIYGMLAARWAGVPHRTALVTGLGYAFTMESDDLRRRVVRGVMGTLYRAAMRHAQTVVFQNADDRDYFVKAKLLDASRARVINGSGVDLTRFAVAPLPPFAAGVRFLLIARLLADKGIREYVEAARRVRAELPEASLHLVGWIDDHPDAIAQEELERWIAEGSIVFHGRLSDVRPIIAESHVYVLPSYREGTPRTVLEAMAMGRAIITSDAPGCRETVEDGLNGYLVPVRDAERLAQAMLRLARDPDQIRSMGRAARELCARKYDVIQVNRELIKHMSVRSAEPAAAGRDAS